MCTLPGEPPTANPFVSTRRKKKVVGSDEDDDASSSSSSSGIQNRKKCRKRLFHSTAQTVKNDELRKRLAKCDVTNPAENPQYSGLVKDLFGVHDKQKLTNIRYCFTECFLDDILTIQLYHKLQEMAEVVDASAQVYGYRVDNTLEDARRTMRMLIPALNELNEESTTKKEREMRKRDQAVDANRQNMRALQDMKPDSDEEPEEDEDNIQFGFSDDEEPTDQHDKYHIAPLNPNRVTADDDIAALIEREAERRLRALDLKKGNNSMLIQDEERFRIRPTEVTDNEFFNQAVSNYTDGKATALLVHSATVSDDGRVIMMHPRINGIVEEEEYVAPNKDFIATTAGILENAMREKPRDLSAFLFDDVDLAENGLAPSITDGKASRMDDVATEFDTRTLKGEEELMMEIMSQQSKRKYEKIDYLTIFRDDFVPEIAAKPAKDDTFFKDLVKSKLSENDNGKPVEWGKDAQCEELLQRAEDEDAILGFEKNGVEDDLRIFEMTWNARLCRKTVVKPDPGNNHPDEDRSHLSVLPKLHVPPGVYTFLGEAPECKKSLLPADEWAHEVAEHLPMAIDIVVHSPSPDTNPAEKDALLAKHMKKLIDKNDKVEELDDDMYNNNDEDNFADAYKMELELLQKDKIEREEKTAEEMHEENEKEDIMGGERILADVPSEEVRNIGKPDDSHWKLAPTHPDNLKLSKKDKKERTQEPDNDEEDYFSLSSKPSMVELTYVENVADLLRDEDEIFLPPPESVKMVQQKRFPITQFFEPFLLPGTSYGKLRLPENEKKKLDSCRVFPYEHMLNKDYKDREPDDFARALHHTKIVHVDDLKKQCIMSPDRVDLHVPRESSRISGAQSFDAFALDGGLEDIPESLMEDDMPELPVPAGEKLVNGCDMYDEDDSDKEDEDRQHATVNGVKYSLKHIRLDTVAMKETIADVLVNPHLDKDALDQVQMIDEEGECDVEQTMVEHPDLMNVTRALFGPHDKHDVTDLDTAILGHHTLQTTFACLPVRLPPRNAGEVTVASTISMMLHIANERNLLLDQDEDEMDGTGWMSDFSVRAADDDGENADTTCNGGDILAGLKPMRAHDPMELELLPNGTDES